MYVPTWLIPVGAELAIVAPAIDHVSEVTEQLSEIPASGTATDAVQAAGSAFWLIFAGQEITGGTVSLIIIV